VTPDPVTPDPVNPGPVNPGPVNPGPVNPGPVNVAAAPSGTRAGTDLLAAPGRAAAVDSGFRMLALGAGLLVLAVLAAIAVSTTQKAWPAFRLEGLSYFTSSDWNPTQHRFGALAFIYGTVMVSAIAVAIGVPVSVGIALFTTEMAPRRLRSLVVTVVDLLAAVPSVVFGLWGLIVLAPWLDGIYDWISARTRGVPVLSSLLAPGVSGTSYFTAGVVLALMITPIVTSVAREVFATVPANDRAGALALGATRWEMIRGVVLPHATGGLVGAIMLGLGRAMGETIAVALLIGGNPRIYASLFGPGDAMPSVIARNLGDAGLYPDYRPALIGLGVTLFVIVVVVNAMARWGVGIAQRRMVGAR